MDDNHDNHDMRPTLIYHSNIINSLYHTLRKVPRVLHYRLQ